MSSQYVATGWFTPVTKTSAFLGVIATLHNVSVIFLLFLIQSLSAQCATPGSGPMPPRDAVVKCDPQYSSSFSTECADMCKSESIWYSIRRKVAL